MSLTNREIYKMSLLVVGSLGLDAQNGDTRAQNNLGVLYYLGKHRNQDYKKAAYWFKEAAEKGYAISQYNLGFMYQKEKGFSFLY